MSGGSYNYLYAKSSEALYDENTLTEIERIATRLIELGHVDAAKETLNLKYTIEQAMIRTEVMKERLAGVWKAVEWFDNCDWSEDEVTEAVERYREGRG